MRIVHAFAEVSDDAKLFMAKWDIKEIFGKWIDARARNGIFHMYYHNREGHQ